MKVSLILPVLNHEDRLEEVLRGIRTQLDSLDPEVIVVYDVTRPELLQQVKADQRDLEKRYGIRTITRVNQRGFGSALRAGFEAASSDVAVPIMADCSDDVGTIPRMLQRISAGADVVAGSRYVAGGGIVGDTTKQRISRLYSWLMGAISGISCHDVSNSFKAYRREVWEQVCTEAESFDFSVEMTVKAAAQGFQVSEVPSVWTNRQTGQSHFGMMKELSSYGRWMLYAARHLPSRGFIGLVLGGVASLLGLAFILSRPLRRRRVRPLS